MTQEYKELLLVDLCARLPYGVIVHFDGWNPEKLSDVDLNTNVYNGMGGLPFPYLRPMSSMTEEEEVEYDATFATIKTADGHYNSTMTYKSFDFLNKHHLDYRGLIPKGLAIEVTKENNPYKI